VLPGPSARCQESYPSIANLQIHRLKSASSSGEQQDAKLTIGIAKLTSLASSAAGSHNVLVGLRTLLDKMPGQKQLWGIRNLSRGDEVSLDEDLIRYYVNQPGSDLLPIIAVSRVNESMMNKIMKFSERLELDGLVFVCGHGEMAIVAGIAEHFSKHNASTRVISILQSPSARARLQDWLPLSLGFDSACATIAEVAGNISLSAPLGSQDVYHFISCGSSTLTLEVAMRIQPMMCLIREDITARKRTLDSIIEEVCDVIVQRHEQGLHTGVILMTDRFYGALDEMRALRAEIHRLKQEQPSDVRTLETAHRALPEDLANFFSMLPAEVCQSLVFRVDADGMPLLRPQESDKEVGFLVSQRLARRAEDGKPSVRNLICQAHNLRNVALCPTPSVLDCNMGFTLGQVAALAIRGKFHGYVASVCNLDKPCRDWGACIVPMVAMIRSGSAVDGLTSERMLAEDDEDKLVQVWRSVQDRWRNKRSYRQPGPEQFCERLDTLSSYTLHAAYSDVGPVVEKEIREEDAAEARGTERPEMLRTLSPRSVEMLSPLQKERLAYQPCMPSVLEDRFQLVEVDNRGRVCANLDTVRSAFPSLWRTENLKAVTLQQVVEETNVLEMLPERSSHLGERGSLSFSVNSLFSPAHRNTSMRLLDKSRSTGTSSEYMFGAMEPDGVPVRTHSGSSLPRLHGMSSGAGMRIAILHVGRPCPGLNSLLAGLLDYVAAINGKVYCIPGGVNGLVTGASFQLTADLMSVHTNQGACDLLGYGDDEFLDVNGGNFESCAEMAKKMQLDGLVVCGGRRAHAWTAELAEYFAELCYPTSVVAVPATASSDFVFMEQSLGYDTSCHTLAYLVGILATQAASSRKQWFFVSITGDSISHLVAEVAMQTHPHVILTSESVERDKLGLPQIRDLICDTIEARSKEDKNYGIVLLNGGLLASVLEMRQLMDEVVEVAARFPERLQRAAGSLHNDHYSQVLHLFSPLARAHFLGFPARVKAQICTVAMRNAREGKSTAPKDFFLIEAEVIFKALVESELTRRVVLGTYKGSFQCTAYSMSYQSEAAMPTNFDCDLGYTSGTAAAVLVEGRRSGYLVDITRLKEPVDKWCVGGTPLSSFLTITEKDDSNEREDSGFDCEPAMRPQLSRPSSLRRESGYRFVIPPRSRLLYDVRFERSMPVASSRTLISPGPVQYTGPCAGMKTHTLTMPSMQRVKQMAQAEQYIKELKTKASAACPPEVLSEIRTLLRGGVELLKQL